MFSKITEEEINYWECFHDPVAMIECLIPENIKAPHIWKDKDCKCVVLRPYQYAMLDYSYLYADDPTKSEKENFRNKKGAGDLINVGSRDIGKSFIEVINNFLTLIHGEGDESLVASFDYGHLKKICQPIANLANFHPFFEIFTKPGKSSVRFVGGGMEIDTVLGHVQYGRNEKIDSPEPGSSFHGIHAKKCSYEEVSYATKKGTEKRIDSGSSVGCIERMSGIPDIRMGSALGDILRDSSKRNWICRLSQYVRSDWDEKTKEEKIKEYGGQECFDDQTEVLTDSGWKKWYQISKNDKVLSLNPKTKKADYHIINDIYIYDFDGQLNYFDNPFINFAVTDNHNLLISTLKKPKLSLVSLEQIYKNKPLRRLSPQGEFEQCIQCGKELSKLKKQKKFCSRSCQMKYMTWEYYPIKKFFIPIGFKWQKKSDSHKILFHKEKNAFGYSFKLDDWLKFLGWYVAEGWVSHSKRYTKNRKKYFSNEIQISQVKSQEYINEIANVLQRMGITVYYNKSSFCFTFNSYSIAQYLEKECGIGARNKRVPKFIKFLSSRQINIFLDAFNKGDGNGQRTLNYTSSFQLAHDLQELIYKVGKESNIVRHQGLQYIITERPIQVHPIAVRDIEKQSYKGKVWCVNVEPFHTLFIRRHDKCMWSGNSLSYKLNVEGELIEGAFGRWDMERIQKLCLNKQRTVKFFELGKNDFADLDIEKDRPTYQQKFYERLDKKLVIEKVPSSLKIVASDIGTTGTASEVIICFGDENKLKWRYNIPLFQLTTQQQALVFKWIYEKLDKAFISIDCTNSDGRSISDELEILGVPQKNIIRPMFNKNMIVDFLRDENGQILRDDKGRPLYKQENVLDWANQELDKIFYGGLIEVPYNEKFLKEFASYFELRIGNSRKYGTSSTDHLVQSFQCMAICRFLNIKNNLSIDNQNQDSFLGGF